MANFGHENLTWAIIPWAIIPPLSRHFVCLSLHEALTCAHQPGVQRFSAVATGEGAYSSVEIIRFQGALMYFPKIQGARTG